MHKRKTHLNIAILSAMAMMSARAGDDGVSLNINYNSIDEVPENFRSLYSEQDGKAVLSRVVGLKTQDDVNNVQEALRKEREDHKAARGILSKFGEREVDDILADLDRIPALEAAAKGSTNIDEQIAGRLQQETAPLKRDLEKVNDENKTLRQQVEQYQLKETQRTITDNVVKYATSSKALPEAVDDIAFIAMSIFETNESGQVVAKNGIPGVTPGISPEVWLTELKRNKPFYWPQSKGAGAGAGEGGQGGNNPWHKDNWNMTEQGRIVRENRTKADQLAAQAGTSVGGARPA